MMTKTKLLACCLMALAAPAHAGSVEPTIALKLDWTLFFGPGAGGSISVDVAHHEVTAMALATKLAPPFRDMLLSGADDVGAPLNLGVELGYSYFLRANRRWWFVGGLVSADRYRVGDARLDALYVVPRVGARVPLGHRFFLEPSLGLALRVVASEPVDGIEVRRIAPVFLLPVGLAW